MFRSRILRQNPTLELRLELRKRVRLLTTTFAFSAFALVVLTRPAITEDGEYSRLVSRCTDLKEPDTAGATIKLAEGDALLCFDGPINKEAQLEPFSRLKNNGVFVVRSPGGHAITAAEIANILRDKNARVVIYDYCLSACANYFFIASHSTYVIRNAIVAWHGGTPGFDKAHMDLYDSTDLFRSFFRSRGIKPDFIYRPQTPYTRKMIDVIAKASARKDNIVWMWNPKNQGNYFSTSIIYERYPESQEEVDDIIRRLRLPIRVVYDPAD